MTRPVSTDTFLAVLRKSKLLAERQIADYLKRSPQLPRDAEGAARALISEGLITSFQADQLLAGRHKGFFLHTGQYKVLRPIGRGGMGTVFLCEHMGLDRRVAIKVLPREQASDPAAVDRFQREARASAALDHPNIVRVHDVNVSAGVALLVMEYVEGKNLQQILEREKRIPYPRAVAYVLQAATGLQHAHERGIIHRDIKPANLLLDRSGTLKILDMGLARFVNKEDGLTQQSGSGLFLGTVDYMAPEQAIPGKPIDSRADLYSLGATLYTLVAGTTPFQGSPSQKLMAHQMRDPVPPHEVCREVPRELSVILARMMAKKPAHRYASAAEVITALAPFAQDPSATSSTIQRPAPRLALSAFRQPRLIAAAAAALFVVVALGWGWSLLRSPAGTSTAQAATSPPADPPATAPAPPAPAVPREKDRRAAPAVVVQTTEKELYRLNLQSQERFLSRIEKREHSSATPFPDSWSGHCWKEESVAEVLAERVGDSMALGFRNLSGDPTCQLCSNLSGSLGNLDKARQYVLRVEYQGQKEADATVYVRRSDGMHIVSGKLKATEGRWEVLDVPIDEDADQARDLAFCTLANGPQSTVFIRSVVLIERPGKDAR